MLTPEQQAAADAEKARTLAIEKATQEAAAATAAAADKARKEQEQAEKDRQRTYTGEEVEQRLRGQGKALKESQELLTAAQARLAALEKAEADRAKAAMTAEERARTEATEAAARVTAKDAELAAAKKGMGRTQAMVVLQGLGAVDPDIALAALPAEATDVGADYQLTAAAREKLTAWATAHPKQFAPGLPGSAPGSAGGGGNGDPLKIANVEPRIDRPYAESAAKKIREIMAAAKPQR